MSVHYYLSNHNLPYSVESIGNRWKQPSIFRENGYSYYHWLHTESGEGIFTYNEKHYEMKPGIGIFIRPFEPHSYHQTSAEEWVVSFISFNGSSAKDIDRFINCERMVIHFEGDSYFQEKIDYWVKRHEQKQVNYIDQSLFSYDFLMHIKKYDDQKSFLEDTSFNSYLKPVIDYIDAHFNDEITVLELANMVFITPQYLSKLFNDYYDCSTHTYVQSIRIEKSKSLLYYYPEKNITQISELSGFKTVSHYISVFKKSTGYTPSQFRKLHFVNYEKYKNRLTE